MLILEVPIPEDLQDGCYTICLYQETCTGDELSPDPTLNVDASYLTGLPSLSILGGTANGTLGISERLDLAFENSLKPACGYTLTIDAFLNGFTADVVISTEPNGQGLVLGTLQNGSNSVYLSFTNSETSTGIYLHAIGFGGEISIDTFSLVCETCFEQVLCSDTIVVGEHCQTKLIRYRNNEDSYGFEYPAGFYNQARVAFRLFKPQFPIQQEAYRQSDGVSRIISAAVETEFEIETDYLPAELHERLRIALSHDILEIWDEKTATWVGYTGQSEYKIDWHKVYQYAKAQSKIRKATYNMYNPNCHTEL